MADDMGDDVARDLVGLFARSARMGFADNLRTQARAFSQAFEEASAQGPAGAGATAAGDDPLDGASVDLEFRTLPMDPEAKWLSDELARAGIPHTSEAAGEGLRVFHIPAEGRDALSGLVDDILARGTFQMDAGRFPNLDEALGAGRARTRVRAMKPEGDLRVFHTVEFASARERDAAMAGLEVGCVRTARVGERALALEVPAGIGNSEAIAAVKAALASLYAQGLSALGKALPPAREPERDAKRAEAEEARMAAVAQASREKHLKRVR